ncbi:MAG: type IV pilus biogenesis protein PilM [Gemmataceae bacterium]
MARFLGIDWDHDRMYLASLRVQGSKVQVEKAIIWEQQHTLAPGAAEEFGTKLKEQLKSAKMAAAPVLACVGRERVILKEVKFPNVDDESQEPALVQFQVNKDLSEPLDRVIIDYARHGNLKNAGNVATVSIVRKEWFTSLQNICQAAGLKIQAFVPRAFGVAACLAHAADGLVAFEPPSPDATVGVITVAQDWAELTVVCGRDILVSRALTGVGDSLVSEVSRTLKIFSTKNSSRPVELVYLAGANEGSVLRDQLAGKLDCPVEMLDPFGLGSSEAITLADGTPLDNVPSLDRGAFTGLIGLGYLQGEKKPIPVNFAAPKKPKVTQGKKRESIIVTVGLVFLVLFVGGFFVQQFLSSKDQAIKKKRQELNDIQASIQAAEPERQKVNKVLEWDNTTLPWADELYNLTAYFPYKVDFRVTSIQVDANQSGTKDEFPVAAKLELLAPDIAHVQEFIEKLNQDDYYTAEKGKEEPASDPRTGGKVRKVLVRVFMKKRPHDQHNIQAFVPEWKKGK